jgi:ABC transporter DrrB family efflux protein
MTTSTLQPVGLTMREHRPPSAIRDIALVTRRNLRRIRRTPRLLVASSVQPVVFTLLFRYVFAGSIHIPGESYANYLLPGILVTATLFGATTAVAMAADLSTGMIDRFRSLPMTRSAVLTGRCLADLARSVIVVAIVLAVGTLVGFRFHNGVPGALGALGLTFAFAFAFMWLYALLGMLVKDPETAQLATIVPTFTFVLASSVFVPVQNMPGWLQAFARNQPISVTVDAVRGLAEGGAIGSFAWQAGLWIISFVVVFGGLAIALYRRA